MHKLLAYLNSLAPMEQALFADRCGTTVGYLRKAISIRQKLGESLCIKIEKESDRKVVCEDIRGDVDWAYLRGTTKPISEACDDSAAPADRRIGIEPGQVLVERRKKAA